MANVYNEAEFRYWLETQCKVEWELNLENGSASFTFVGGMPATSFDYSIYPHVISPTWRPAHVLAMAFETLPTGVEARHGYKTAEDIPGWYPIPRSGWTANSGFTDFVRFPANAAVEPGRKISLACPYYNKHYLQDQAVIFAERIANEYYNEGPLSEKGKILEKAVNLYIGAVLTFVATAPGHDSKICKVFLQPKSYASADFIDIV